MRLEDVVAVMGKMRLLRLYKLLVGKSDGKRQLGRPDSRREGNIKMPRKEVVCGYVDWTKFDQDRVQGSFTV
jgi:hypothetical protein